MKGKAFTDTTIYCGSDKEENCDEFTQVSGITFAQEIRKIGWVKTKKFGWVCPECYKNK